MLVDKETKVSLESSDLLILLFTACFGYIELGVNDRNVLDLISSLYSIWLESNCWIKLVLAF